MSRSKNGVASLAYYPAVHVFATQRKAWKPGHDESLSHHSWKTL
jgi:hypothetical protein